MRLRVAVLLGLSVVMLTLGCGGDEDPTSVSANDLNSSGELWAQLDTDLKVQLVVLGKERLANEREEGRSKIYGVANDKLVAAIDDEYSDSDNSNISIYDTYLAVNDDLDRKTIEDANAPPEPTTATLEAVEGQSGSGTAEFGFSGTELAANLEVENLEPSADGETYTAWLTGPENVAYPITQQDVGDDGTINGQLAISEEIICFIAADAFTDLTVSRVSESEMKSTLAAAGKANDGKGDFPDYIGETVVTGPIVMPYAAKKQVIPTCNT